MSEEKAPFDFYSLGEPEEGNPEPVVEVPVTEEVVEESPEVEEPTTPTVTVKTPYTTEEIADLIRNDGEVDITRLSPEGQAVMKAMQRGFTPKLQEAAELKRELDKFRQELDAAKPKEQPKDIYEAYDQDPKGVLEYINGEIQRLAYGDEAYKNVALVERLRDVKEELRVRELQKVQTTTSKQAEMQMYMSEISKAVPDIQTKQHALKEFALNVLGYTEEELMQETNPAVRGISAVRAIDRINKAYDKLNAKNTVQKKVVKQPATTVETPGNGFQKQDVSMKDKITQAKKDGNWRSVFLDLEE